MRTQMVCFLVILEMFELSFILNCIEDISEGLVKERIKFPRLHILVLIFHNFKLILSVKVCGKFIDFLKVY